MDVLYKGGDLLRTQLTAVANMALLLPRCVLSNMSSSSSSGSSVHTMSQPQGADTQQKEQQPSPAGGSSNSHPTTQTGAVFYDGKVLHSRRQPVNNSFE